MIFAQDIVADLQDQTYKPAQTPLLTIEEFTDNMTFELCIAVHLVMMDL